MRISFDGIANPVALVGCDELVADIAAVLHGWRFAETAPSPEIPPEITIRRTAGGYVLESRWQNDPPVYSDRVDMVCSFLVDLVKAYNADDPSLLCLHCAAAEFAGRLVIFPNHYGTGKSVLSAHLAAAGVRLYADDVLPLREPGDRGIAPGILPRLRLPLPDGAGAAFRDFVARRTRLANERFVYLDLEAGELAAHGEEAPIGSFVLLQRDGTSPPEIASIGKSEMLKRVILRNFADLQAVDILDRLLDLVGEAPCFTLRYGDGAEASQLLKRWFMRWPPPRASGAEAPSLAPVSLADDGQRPVDGCFRRNPEIVARAVEHELFLVNPAGEDIYHLNVIGAGLWRLLVEPTDVDTAVAVLHQAFPDIARAQIEADVATALGDLVARGLVLDAG